MKKLNKFPTTEASPTFQCSCGASAYYVTIVDGQVAAYCQQHVPNPLRWAVEKIKAEPATVPVVKEQPGIPATKPKDIAARLKQAAEKPAEPQAPHLMIIARAGTGKTTTLVEGLKNLRGLKTSIQPSPQQEAIWKAMKQGPTPRSICFVAFNKPIADELETKVPEGCDAMTMHRMGLRAVNRAFGPKTLTLNDGAVEEMIAKAAGKDLRWLKREKFEIVRLVEKLVGYCKTSLVHPWDNESLRSMGLSFVEALDQLSSRYELDLNGMKDEVYALTAKTLVLSKDPKQTGLIAFDDMIWLPAVLNLSVYRYDLLLVDEAQDLNRCQQALALKAGARLILCGDDRQAIYGFSGADSESMERMKEQLTGCQVLPLTVTRRCGRAIVEEANNYVPDFEAHSSNPLGKVDSLWQMDPKGRSCTFCRGTKQVHGSACERCSASGREPNYRVAVMDGDMILCRCNAPLVSECYKFLKEERQAKILGRDVGQGLISTVTKQKAETISELISKLGDWLANEREKEQAKRTPSEARLINLQDRYDCIMTFVEGAGSITEVIGKIERIFTDDRKSAGVRLASIHKAKGLEAKRVFFLMPKGAECPHPKAKSAWQRSQELNLRYVGITRAIEELHYVS